MMSALNGHVEVVRLLLEWKCNVSMAAYNRRTALHLAAERGKQECCEMLLDAGAFIDAQDGAGATPLHVAVMKGQLQVSPCLKTLSTGWGGGGGWRGENGEGLL